MTQLDSDVSFAVKLMKAKKERNKRLNENK